MTSASRRARQSCPLFGSGQSYWFEYGVHYFREAGCLKEIPFHTRNAIKTSENLLLFYIGEDIVPPGMWYGVWNRI